MRNKIQHLSKKSLYTSNSNLGERNAVLEATIENKRKFHLWQSDYYAFLKAFDWEAEKKLYDRYIRNDLKKMWESNSPFYRCTNQALIFVSNQLAELTEEFHAWQVS